MDTTTRERLQQHLVRLAAGDRAAFDVVYELVAPIVHRVALRALHHPSDAEDAAQTALLKIFARASEFDPERDALAWVVGVIAWECRTLRRREIRRREDFLEAPRIDPQRSPEDEAIFADLHAAAVDVLGSLRPLDVETLEAVFRDERPDVPSVTFRKRVERALGRLRARSRRRPSRASAGCSAARSWGPRVCSAWRSRPS